MALILFLIAIPLILLVIAIVATSESEEEKLNRLAKEEQLKARIKFMSEYEFSDVLKEKLKVGKPGWSNDVYDAAWSGLREFFLIKIYASGLGENGVLGMPSVMVDEAWHIMLEDEAEYTRFCEKAFGSELVHIKKDGAVPQKIMSKNDIGEDTSNTFKIAKKLYKAYPNLYPEKDVGKMKMSGATGIAALVPLMFLMDEAYADQYGEIGWSYGADALKELIKDSANGGTSGSGCSAGAAGGSGGCSCGGGGCGC